MTGVQTCALPILLGAVVDGVEAPEQGNFVGPTMPPIGADVSDDERSDDPNRGGPCSSRRSDSSGNRVLSEPSHERKRHAQQEAWNETVEEVIGDIGEDRFPEYLLRVKRKETLERHKDDAEEHQPYAEPEDGDNKIMIEVSRHFVISYQVMMKARSGQARVGLARITPPYASPAWVGSRRLRRRYARPAKIGRASCRERVCLYV